MMIDYALNAGYRTSFSGALTLGLDPQFMLDLIKALFVNQRAYNTCGSEMKLEDYIIVEDNPSASVRYV